MIQSINLQINGKSVTEPIDWQGISINSLFTGLSNLASTEGFSFILIDDAFKAVQKHIKNGDIFKGLPATLQIQEDDLKVNVINGYFDLTNEYEEEEDRCKVSFKTLRGKEQILNQLEGLTALLLYREGWIKDSDFVDGNFVVEKPIETEKLILTIVLIYELQEQIRVLTKELVYIIAEISSFVATLPGGSVGAVILTAAKLIGKLAYYVAVLILLTKMIVDIVSLFFLLPFQSKGISWKKLLSAPFERAGYTFVSDIQELNYIYYPSAPIQTETSFFKNILPVFPKNKVGIPKSSDFGYLSSEWVDFCTKIFDGEFYFDGNTVTFFSKKFPIEKKQKPFRFDDIYLPSFKLNTNELKASKYVTFSYDSANQWSMNDFTNCSYEKRSYMDYNNKEVRLLKGLDESRFPLAVAPRKNSKNDIQKFISEVVKIANNLAKFMGGNIPKSLTTDTIGCIVLSDPYWSTPYIATTSGNLETGYKSKISPKYFIEKYWNTYKQFKLVEGLVIPCTLKEFEGIMSNKNALINGKTCEFSKAEYLFDRGVINCDIKIPYLYTNKIKEVGYE